MSHLMTALAMQQKGLKPAEKVVLYWLADHHNGDTGNCFPRIERLAALCEMSRRSVENQLSSLEAHGLIKRNDRRRDDGGKTSNGYILTLDDTHTQNLRRGSAKSAQGDAQNLRINNLVSNNLVSEPYPPTPTEAELAFSEYNEAAAISGWPMAQALTKQRKANIASRLKDAGGIEGWRTALEKAAASDFLSGRKTDFMVSLDFILQASSFTKLMEGNYDNRTSNNSGLRPSEDPTLRAIFDAASDIATRGMDRN
ncbi:helix-turn-helix domain-containing protein [Lentibacter algarum]|uniref:helix-turn-helix domain-containing protein n=1 Tax=Lentibacter algarum TaxID=576131 RepID=UPI0026F1629C|nr:helix-turn-helix domain-containing protein [Lentibacter algarum]